MPDSSTHPDAAPRIPVVLGVSGHRALRPQDDAALRAAAAAIFADFRARYPHTPLVLLSSLARGADQLVAEAARDRGVVVRVALPFPARVYRESSTFEGHPAEGQAMLDWVDDQRVEAFVVPLPGAPAADDVSGWRQLAADEHARHTAYANAGGYIVRHCHALIALWDGDHAGKPSGTEEIVDAKLDGRPPALYPHRAPLSFGSESGPVYVIHAPRAGAADAPDGPSPGRLSVLVPNAGTVPVPSRALAWRPGRFFRLWHRVSESFALHGKQPAQIAEWRQFHETCQSIDDFNRDAVNSDALIRRSIEKKLLLPGFWQHVGQMGPPHALRRLVGLREAAATLSRRIDEGFIRWQLILFAALFLAVLCFHLYAHLEVGQAEGVHLPWLLVGFVGLLALCTLIIIGVWFCRLSERRLDYRTLAEAARVNVFWGSAGIGEDVADSYLGQMRTEMSWARRALQSAAPPAAAWKDAFDLLSAPQKLAVLREVEAAWVTEQRDWFKKNQHFRHVSAVRLRQWGFFCAMAGWTVAAGLLALHSAGVSAAHPGHWSLIASGSLVLLGGILVAYCERCSHEELAKQYERMATVFKQGAREIGEHLQRGDLARAQAVLVALGREAITENVQWLILRRSRPFELLIH